MARIHGRVAARLTKLTRTYSYLALVLILSSSILTLVVALTPLEKLIFRLLLTLTSVTLIIGAGICTKRAVGYRKGVRGEMEVFRRLKSLPRSYHVFPDVDLFKGDIDFVVVGPTGVFAIEVKYWKGGRLIPLKGELWKRRFTVRDYRLIRSPVSQVKEYAERLKALLEVPVEPVLVITGSVSIKQRKWEGVPILKPKRVYRYILSKEETLDKRTIREIVRRLKFFKELAD
ncbi:MAG: hypothetical protein DRJ63_07190 [Thermoprotei archaeon]|nr:MAG: hypothetical protein DRJ63_07190 [Thermoprotei archaeon]